MKLQPPRRSVSSYEEVITDFYVHYPKKRTVAAVDVLDLLMYDYDSKLTSKDLDAQIKLTTK